MGGTQDQRKVCVEAQVPSEEGTDGKEGRQEGQEKAWGGGRRESGKVRRGRRGGGGRGREGEAASLSVCD